MIPRLDTATEDELKRLFESLVGDSFEITPEVKGVHLLEHCRVIADYIIRPIPSLIQNGFDDITIAVEVKSNLGNSNGVIKLNTAVWQAATYVQSEFDGIRPAFAIVFPSPIVFCAADNFDMNPDAQRAAVLWTTNAITHLAMFMNVGFLEIKDGEWVIKIGGNRYYSSAKGKGPQNLIKRYVGNVRK